MAEKREEIPGSWVMTTPYIYILTHAMTLLAAVLLCGALSEITVQKTVITFVALTMVRFAARADAAKLGWNIVRLMEKR